jgi:hypothetical protein
MASGTFQFILSSIMATKNIRRWQIGDVQVTRNGRGRIVGNTKNWRLVRE